MIQKRFKELQPYLRGVKLAGEYSVVECILKNTWKIDGIVPGNVQYKSGKESEEYKGYISHMFWAEDTIDNLVETLETIVNTNIEMEQKQALLRSKVEELKKMFEDKSLDELKGLKFSSDIDVTLKVTKSETPSKTVKENENTKSNVVA